MDNPENIVRNAHMGVIEADTLSLLLYTSINIFIALGWCSEMIMVLLMNILNRTMNT